MLMYGDGDQLIGQEPLLRLPREARLRIWYGGPCSVRRMRACSQNAKLQGPGDCSRRRAEPPGASAAAQARRGSTILSPQRWQWGKQRQWVPGFLVSRQFGLHCRREVDWGEIRLQPQALGVSRGRPKEWRSLSEKLSEDRSLASFVSHQENRSSIALAEFNGVVLLATLLTSW